MRHIVYEQADTYPFAILIKGAAFNQRAILEHYVLPLESRGLSRKDVIAFRAEYDTNNKAPAAFIKARLAELLPVLQELKTKVLYVADSNYFKVLTGQPKADTHHGYSMPCKIKGFTDIQVVLGINYQALIYNPDLGSKMITSLAVVADIAHGTYSPPGSGIIHSAHYPKTLEGIRLTLEKLHQFPELTCDIEAFSLRFWEAGIATIAFAWDKHNGVAFACDYCDLKNSDQEYGNPYYGVFYQNFEVRTLIRKFFETYKGKLTFHNAAYDVKVNIYTLWMKNMLDTQGLLQGLEIMTRDFHDTQIIAYLATNSTAGNILGLKPLAQEFAGNWAVEVTDVRKVPLDDLLQYNLVDALSTWYVKEKYWPIMEADQQLELYESLMLPSQRLIIQIELTGMPMSRDQIAKTRTNLAAVAAKHLHVLTTSPVIKTLNLLLQKFEWQKDYETRKSKAKNPDKIKIKDIDAFAAIEFNPNSGQQMQKLLYDLMGLPVLDYTETKQPATGGDTLEKLLNHTTVPEYKEIIEALIGYGKVEKILSSFLPAFERAVAKADDGIVWLHGSLKLGGTVSGRLSSCVAPWTRIKTHRGLVPITELKIGDRVWTHQRRWQPVQDIILKPVTPMVNVRFCNGYILTCTKAHKLRLPGGQWKTVQEIIDEHIEIVDAESGEHTGNRGGVPQCPTSHTRADCRRSGNLISQCQPCSEAAPADSRVSSRESLALFNLERGGAQSHEGQDRATASQLGWGMPGQKRLSDNPAPWGTSVCASRHHGRGLGNDNPTRTDGSPSYRRESTEQSLGQSGFSHPCGASADSLTSGHDCYGKIAQIHDREPLPVWDITVAEDHSYWAEGCFNHNSDPNMQNIPAGSDYGKIIKECFVAPAGWLFAGADFNSLEDYISALTTKDPNKLKVYAGSKQFDVSINGVIHRIREEDVVNFDGQQLNGLELYAKLQSCSPRDVHNL